MKNFIIVLLGCILAAGIIFTSFIYNKTTIDAINEYGRNNSLNMKVLKEIPLDSRRMITISKDEDNLFYVFILLKKHLAGWEVEKSGRGLDLENNKVRFLDDKGEDVYLTKNIFYFDSDNDCPGIGISTGFLTGDDYKGICINGLNYKLVKICDKTYFYYEDECVEDNEEPYNIRTVR